MKHFVKVINQKEEAFQVFKVKMSTSERYYDTKIVRKSLLGSGFANCLRMKRLVGRKDKNGLENLLSTTFCVIEDLKTMMLLLMSRIGWQNVV